MSKKRTISCIAVSILILAIFSLSVNANIQTNPKAIEPTIFNDDDWPMFRHDQTRTGSTSSTAPNTDRILWTYTPPIDTWLAESSPVVTNGKVYIGACELKNLLPIYGKVICLNENTGELVWTYQTDGWVLSTPAVVDDKLYVGSFFDSTVHCIDANNGNPIWTYIAGVWIFSSPLVAYNKVYIGCNDGKLYCLNSTNGNYIWIYPTGDCITSTTTEYENKIYILS